MKEENQPSDDNVTQTPQGIFSSPDLSVNSENLEEIKPELSEENKSRIASAFAKTDATQRQGQLADKMADQDAISGTVIPATNSTTSTATGDIKLSGAKKKSKFPFILATIVLLAVVGGVVAWLVLGHSSREKAPVTPSQAFTEYREYMVKGPSDQNDADAWFLFTVGENGMPEEDQADYLNELSNRFNTFIDTVKDSPVIKPDHSLLLEVSESYQQILTLIVDGKNLNGLSAQLLKRYLDSGASTARAYIDELTEKLSGTISSFATRNVANGIIRYIESQFSAIEIYNLQGCIVNNEIDYAACDLDETSNLTLNRTLEERAGAEQTIRGNLPVLEQLLENQTDELSKLVMEGESA